MKNGDPRSRAWIRRALKTYVRDDQATQTLLMLVSVDPTPSLDEIRTWTDEQCLLAEDWAAAAHLRASDNINRVPAVPAHLKAYQRRYPQRTPKAAARAAVRAMSDDNGNCYHPTDRQWTRLEEGISRMQGAGCFFTDAEIELLAAGEHGETLAALAHFDGFDVAYEALCAIFDELDDVGRVKGDEQRAADKRAHHA